MRKREDYISKLREAETRIKEEFAVKGLTLFGSVARDAVKADSDVDVLVEMPPKAYQLIALRQFLENLFKRKVDVVRRRASLDELLLKEIERDGIRVF